MVETRFIDASSDQSFVLQKDNLTHGCGVDQSCVDSSSVVDEYLFDDPADSHADKPATVTESELEAFIETFGRPVDAIPQFSPADVVRFIPGLVDRFLKATRYLWGGGTDERTVFQIVLIIHHFPIRDQFETELVRRISSEPFGESIVRNMQKYDGSIFDAILRIEFQYEDPVDLMELEDYRERGRLVRSARDFEYIASGFKHDLLDWSSYTSKAVVGGLLLLQLTPIGPALDAFLLEVAVTYGPFVVIPWIGKNTYESVVTKGREREQQLKELGGSVGGAVMVGGAAILRAARLASLAEVGTGTSGAMPRGQVLSYPGDIATTEPSVVAAEGLGAEVVGFADWKTANPLAVRMATDVGAGGSSSAAGRSGFSSWSRTVGRFLRNGFGMGADDMVAMGPHEASGTEALMGSVETTWTDGATVRVLSPDEAITEGGASTLSSVGKFFGQWINPENAFFAAVTGMFVNEGTESNLDERARRILRDGLSIEIGGQNLEDAARKFAEESALAWRLGVLREEARRLREMGLDAQADQIEQKMGALSDAFAAKWGGIPASGPVASAAKASRAAPVAAGVRKKKGEVIDFRGALQDQFDRAVDDLEAMAAELTTERIASPESFYFQGMKALGVVAKTATRSEVEITDEQAHRLLNAEATVLPRILELGLVHYTDQGFDPSVGEERLRDMLFSRMRYAVIVDRLMSNVAERKYPLTKSGYTDLPAEMRSVVYAVIDALNSFQQNGTIPRIAFLSLMDEGQTATVVAAIRSVDSNPSQLRSFLFGFLPGIYCINIAQDFSGMNKISTTAGTRLKWTEVYLLRAFVVSDLSVDAFINDPQLVNRLMNPADDMPMGTVTVVNSTTISVQAESTDRVKLFLENSETLVRGVLEKLIIERDRLRLQQSQGRALGRAERERLRFLDKLTEGFMPTDDGPVFFPAASAADSIFSGIPFSSIFRPLYGGYVGFQGVEDLPLRSRNLSVIDRAVARMRDETYNLSEVHFKAVRQQGPSLDSPVLVALGEIELPSDQHLTWRLGRPPSDAETYRALKTAANRIRTGRTEGADRRLRGRIFHFLTADDLENVLVGVAQQFLGSGRTSLTGQSDAANLARTWLEILQDPNADEREVNSQEVVRAVQLAFREPVTDSRLLALYREAGGLVDPQRYARELQGFVGDVEVMAAGFESEPPVWVTGDEASRREFDDLMAKQASMYPRLSELAYHPRDRVTRNWDYLGAAGMQTMQDYFDKYGIPEEQRDVLIVTIELQQGKTLDTQVNPPLSHHLMDPNMGPLRRVMHKVAKRIYGVNEDSEFPFEYPDDCVEAYARGDEIVGIFPAVDRQGEVVTMQRIEQEVREVIREMFPKEVHYLGKVAMGANTERLPLWMASASEAVGGEPLIIAANNVKGQPSFETGAWLLTGGAFQHYPYEESGSVSDFQPVMGPIGVRIVGQEFQLKDLTADRILQAGATGMEADVTLQHTAQEQGLDPTAGVYMLQPDGRVVQVLPQ